MDDMGEFWHISFFTYLWVDVRVQGGGCLCQGCGSFCNVFFGRVCWVSKASSRESDYPNIPHLTDIGIVRDGCKKVNHSPQQ